MNENGGSKVMGIRQIVRLKEFLQKWQSVTLGPKPSNSQSGSSHGVISQAVNNRLSSKYYDSDDDSCDSPGPPPDIRTGYLAVYVGPELRRFIIPTSCLSHSLFKVLLEKAEEEFGFDHSGGLTIPCEIETFKYLLQYMENHPEHHADDNSAGDSPAIED